MSKHTPGPWTAKTKTTRFAVTSQHLTVAHVIGLDAAAKADARLIAAAPDLLEVLRLAEAALADIGDADREPGDDLAWCEARAAQDLPAIRAAIAKAEGQ